MNSRRLILRSVRHYARTHIGVVAGCAISAAVLVGALFVGDSVRHSLERIALARLGKVHVAIDSGSRYFGAALAERIAPHLNTPVTAALRVDGMALREKAEGGWRQVNRVDVLGVDDGFFRLAPTDPGIRLAAGEVAINAKLAAALGAEPGDEIALRMFKPGLLSRDAPLASKKEPRTQRRLLTLAAILDDEQFGRFSLKSDQTSPNNAFVSLEWLQQNLEREGRANMLLAGETTADAAARALAESWALEDAGLRTTALDGRDVLQLSSSRIYLDPTVARAALDVGESAVGSLTYLVDSIAEAGGASTPYSFITAVSPSADGRLSLIPPDMRHDEILVNRWLADELSLGPGDPVEIAYSELAAGDEFIARTRTFTVHGILEMDTLAAERELVPAFPGLTDVDRCEDWEVGITTDEEKLADEANEAYWEDFRTTPKALVTLAAGRVMWANRYGDLMAVRYPLSEGDATQMRSELRDRINPETVGLAVRPVRHEALRAVNESMDLGQLFLGMSFFLIAASLMLTAMLFVFSVEQRAREMGVLLAVGFSKWRVRRLFLGEGAIIAAVGSIAGVPLGWAFAKYLLQGLTTMWSGAVADTSIAFHATAGSAVIGAIAATAVSLLTIGIAMWRQARRPVRQLVAEDFSQVVEGRAAAARSGRIRVAVFVLATVGAAAVAAWTMLSGAQRPAGAFFAAGSLMLVGGIALVRMILDRMSTTSGDRVSLARLGVRNACRRPGRGIATAGILACGCFIVFSVSAMKEDLAVQAGERASGTGGFELFGESSIAVHEDLNSEEAREAFRLTDDERLRDVSIFPIRVREGDDASCLNLNQSLTPPLLGVDPDALTELGAFASPAEAEKLWGLLNEEYPDGVVPAIIGDSATAVWKLKKKVGRRNGALLEYLDEHGEPFRVKLVAAIPMRLTVLQGRLLIADRDFMRRYPSESGYRMFLADTPPGSETEVSEYLTDKLDRVGLDLVPSVERLREFYVVESTYLMMFVVLGGMGLLLGTAGMGVLVLRNVMERRGELALLRAVGYSRRQAGGVVMAEHRFLLAAGLAVGTVAAALAIAPSVARPDAAVPFGLLAAFLLGTLTLSLAWIWIAARLALRGPLVPSLRSE